jgi:hypothetical protein
MQETIASAAGRLLASAARSAQALGLATIESAARRRRLS